MGGTRFFFTKISFYNVQRAINLKTGKQQLWFLCSASGLIVVNISVMFVKISQTVFKFLSGNDFMTNKRDMQLFLKLTLFRLSELVIIHPLGKHWKLIPHFLKGFKNVALQDLFIYLFIRDSNEKRCFLGIY